MSQRTKKELVKTNNAEIVTNSYIKNAAMYFDKHDNFDSYLFMKELLNKLNIIYIEKIGFYIFNNRYWQSVEEGFISKIIHKGLEKFAKPKYVSEVLKSIKNEVYRPLEILNKNRSRIVLKNGTLDLSQWESPYFYDNEYFLEDYSTIYLDYNYDIKAVYPKFQRYLDSTFVGYPDDVKTVQEMFGYCLTTSTKFEKIFILYGEGGTGKSVLIDTLKKLVTEKNYCSIPMSLLDKSFLRAGLKDKTLNLATEESSKTMRETVTAWIKAISSGDPIEAQFKNKDTFNFNPFCKLVFAMNNLPQFENFDEALKRRMIIIKFNHKFRGDNIDLELKEGKLYKEMDGILLWALEGLKRLAKQKSFTYSQQAIECVENYRLESNHAERFAHEYLDVGEPESFIKVKDAYKKYCDVCKANNEKPFKNPEFCTIIKRKYNLPEKREQKKIKQNNGSFITEDVFKTLLFKDSSKDNNVIPLKKSS